MLEVCAELSANHLGSFHRAMRIADAAADAGADLFKVQVWTPDTMCIDPSYTLAEGPWKGRTLVDLYREAHTPWVWLPHLFEHCRELGMEPFGAAFDRASVDYLCELGVKRLKVASFELTDLPLIRYMASKGKPLIISTGMATMDEIIRALDAADVDDVTLLQCVSSYPADASDSNLASMIGKRDCFLTLGSPDVGLSDHSLGIGVAVAAAALGASYIEKHLTLNRADGGPDAGFSMEPAEFKQMVTECRRAVFAIGEVRYGPTKGESTELRRSLWVSCDVEAGEVLALNFNVVTTRPALGLPPSFADKMLPPPNELRAKHAIKANTPLTADLIA